MHDDKHYKLETQDINLSGSVFLGAYCDSNLSAAAEMRL